MTELIISFLVLSFLEIILGIDNIIFISLIANKVKENIRNNVRLFGLLLSLALRLTMLFFITLLLKLTTPLFSIFTIGISVKDLIMILGGLFLIIKGGLSIYEEVFLVHEKVMTRKETVVAAGALYSIIQIVIVDFVFSLDSLITAIGLTNHYLTIAGAIIVSVIFMIIFAPKVGYFIDNYPELKILAIVFIFLIGFILVLEGLSIHVNKSYLYFAIGFALLAEILNIIMKKNIDKVK
ncbi:MAG: TerC family protein [Alphaproteobacteria bacterium]|jgi:predicted tellurium resistance membrane protein TerC|nr:TerC family protein [Alphaproteobacteria bacterium]